MNNIIVKAIQNMNLIEFNYGGGVRVLEPHCYGITSKGNEAIRAYQVSGYTSSGKYEFKLFDLSKAGTITVLDERFEKPRPEYRRGDKHMRSIICEL